MLLKVDDVVSILQVSKPKAYKVIQTLNKEMKEKKYYVIPGRIEERYLYERFGIDKNHKETR